VGGKKGAVNYSQNENGSWKFQFVSTDGGKVEETYAANGRPGGGGGRQPRGEGRGPKPGREEAPSPPAAKNGAFVLTSPVVKEAAICRSTSPATAKARRRRSNGPATPRARRAFAVIMDHVDPEGMTKWYWTLYDLPSGTKEACPRMCGHRAKPARDSKAGGLRAAALQRPGARPM